MRIIFTHSELEQRWIIIRKFRRSIFVSLAVMSFLFVVSIVYMGWEIYSGSVTGGSGQFANVAKVYASGGTGSAFYIGRSYALSAAHVVNEDAKVKLEFDKGSLTCEAAVLYTDTKLDIALLSVPDLPSLAPMTVGDSDLSLVGEPVLTIGYPLGDFSVTKGIISNTTGTIITTDAANNPGNSGGPMISEDTNEVIGIVISIALLSEEVPADGKAYAVAISRIREALADAGYPI